MSHDYIIVTVIVSVLINIFAIAGTRESAQPTIKFFATMTIRLRSFEPNNVGFIVDDARFATTVLLPKQRERDFKPSPDTLTRSRLFPAFRNVRLPQPGTWCFSRY